MENPLFIPMRFAANGIKNVIQKVLQVGQDPEDMTWNSGTPQITMIPKEEGGLPPKGQDFNGVLYTLKNGLLMSLVWALIFKQEYRYNENMPIAIPIFFILNGFGFYLG
jgi:hypothetical protein